MYATRYITVYVGCLPVTRQRWQLHHLIRRTRKLHAAHKHHGSVFDYVDPMTFVYELDL